MDAVRVARQPRQQQGSTFRAEAGDDPLALPHAQPAQQFDS
jgi:hypothetical protein